MADGGLGEKAAVTNGPSLLDLYTAHIAYIRHENDLLHQRVTWLLAVQAGTLAAMSLSMQKYFEIFIKDGWAEHLVTRPSIDVMATQVLIWTQFVVYWFFIAVIGWGCAGLAKKPVQAARDAQSAIEAAWARRFKARADEQGFPALMGGGRASAGKDGGNFAVRLSGFFEIAWPWVGSLVIICSCPFIQLHLWRFAKWALERAPFLVGG